MLDGFTIGTGYELLKIAKREGVFQRLIDAFRKQHRVIILGSTGVGKSQFVRSLNEVVSAPLSHTERTEFVSLSRIEIGDTLFSLADTRRLADGSLALSFRSLLTHLATIVRNTMRPKDAKPGMGTFTLTTGANPKQRQALDLAAAIAA